MAKKPTAKEHKIREVRRQLVDAVLAARKKIWTDERIDFLMPYPLYKTDSATQTVIFANAIKIRLLKTGRLKIERLRADVPTSLLNQPLEYLASEWNNHICAEYAQQLRTAVVDLWKPCPKEWAPVRKAANKLTKLLNHDHNHISNIPTWIEKRCPFSPARMAGVKNIQAVGRLLRIQVSQFIEAHPVVAQVKKSFMWWRPVRLLNVKRWNKLVRVAPLLSHLRTENKRLALPYVTSHCWAWLDGDENTAPACLHRPPEEAISYWRTSLIEAGLSPAAWRWITHLASPQLMALVSTPHNDGLECSGHWKQMIPILNHVVARQLPVHQQIKWIKYRWLGGVDNPRLNALSEAVVLHRHQSRRAMGTGKTREAFDTALFEEVRSIIDYLNGGHRHAGRPTDEVLAQIGMEWPNPDYVTEGLTIVIPKGVGFKWFQRHSTAWHQKMEAVWVARNEIINRIHHQPQTQLTWDSALSESALGDYQVVPMTSGIALAEEGAAMRHCVAGYATICAGHGHRIFSIRRNGDRVATLEIGPRQQGPRNLIAAYEVFQVRGKCNHPVPDDVRAIATRIANAYTSAVSLSPSAP